MNVNLEDYITDGAECFEINLIRPSKDGAPEPVFSESFNPTYTHEFFGEKGAIIGYKEPTIQLNFRANDMRPSLQVGFEEQVELPEEVYSEDHRKVDFSSVFAERIPSWSATLEKADVQHTNPEQDPKSKQWKPPGTLLHKMTLHGKQYEIWKASFTDPAAKQLWDNVQILALLFVDGASLPDIDDDWSSERWTLHMLYEVTPIEEDMSPYTLAGFSNSYRFWSLPISEIMRATKSLPSPAASTNGEAFRWSPPKITQDPETFLINEQVNTLEQPSRERISQFMILPPYQGQSLGATLYDVMFADLAKQPFIHEITVEDPNEEFDAVRDYSDILYLRSIPSFASLSIPSTIAKEKLAKAAPIPRDEILGSKDLARLRRETKIVSRQFDRMTELHLLSTIPPAHRKRQRITRKDRASNENDRKYYFWRLAVKDRIYRQNRDSLENMEEGEEALTSAQKVDMVEQAVDNQQEEYERRLQGLEKRLKWSNGEAQEASESRSKRKRAIVDDDEDDEWEDMDEDVAGSSKRARTEDVQSDSDM